MTKTLLRKIVLWTAASLLLLLIIAALALPRLINTEATRNAIEGTISRELHGTLTYDRVVLSLLPRPRIVLQHPKIEIPKKGAASMDMLDIYPALLPLLTGTIRIDRVRLGEPQVTLLLQDGPAPAAQRKRPAAPPGPSTEEVLAVAAKSMPGINITIENGGLTVIRRSEQVLSISALDAHAVFLPPQTAAAGTNPAMDAVFRIEGSASCSVDAPGLPAGPLALTVERFEALPRAFIFSRTRVRILDLSLNLSGSIYGSLSAPRKTDIALSGSAGPNALTWLRDGLSLPPLLTLRSPLSLSDTRIRWDQGGTLQAAGRAAVRKGPSIDFDVQRSAGRLSLKSLAIRDAESQALFTAELADRVMDASFSGNVTRHSLNTLLDQQSFQFGWLKGDLKARLPLDRLADSSFEGALEAEQMTVPWRKPVPFMIDHLVLQARGRTAQLAPAAVTVGASQAVFTGSIEAGEKGFTLDIDAASREISWDDVQAVFFSPEKRSQDTGAEGQAGPAARSPKEGASVHGALRVNVDILQGKRYRFEGLRGTIFFERDSTRYDVREASLCGIRVAGAVSIINKENDLSLRLSAKEQELGRTLTCLAGADVKVSGTYDLSGDIRGKGRNEGLLSALQGQIAFVSKNGRVYNDYIVVPILKYKRIADLLGDRLPDARKNGIPYDTFGIRGTIARGTLTVSEGVIKSPLMNLAARGDIDLMKDRIDITVLMAPFRTVDAVVKKIPLLGNILGGTLVTVPLRVQGSFKDPKVSTLPPSAVGEGLLGIMKRTLELPFTVVEDIERSAPTTSAR